MSNASGENNAIASIYTLHFYEVNAQISSLTVITCEIVTGIRNLAYLTKKYNISIDLSCNRWIIFTHILYL